MLKTGINSITPRVTLSPMSWQEPVAKSLIRVEERLHEVPEGQHDLLTEASERLLSSGGKRIRPTINLLAAGMFDTIDDRAVSVAAGIEMLHTATLVHDDLIDRSVLRRGEPTLNSDLSIDTTVLTGDYLFARAASLVAEADNVLVMDLFAGTLMTILNGEINQRFTKWQIDRDIYADRIYAKTAAMFVLATQTASVLGISEPSKEQAMVEFGRNVGIAFQIIDDVLDFTGDSNRLGKPIGSDLRQGIITLPVISFLEKYPQDEVSQILIQENPLNRDQVDQVIATILASDAIEAAFEEAHQHIQLGLAQIKKFPETAYRTALESIAGYIVERDI
jgi:geranylgeranyl pyrophosphate synthase